MFLTYLPGAIAILAGLFLATLTAKGPDSMIELLANGIGWYFVARGIYMLTHLRGLQSMLQGLAQSIKETANDAPNKATHKQCDACYLWVPRGAVKCGHCGTQLEGPAP